MLREGTGGRARGWEASQGRNPRGRGLQGAAGSWYVQAGEREEKRGIHSASLQLCFLGHWTNSLMEERLEEEQSWWTGQELTQGAGGLQTTSGHPRGDTKEARG